MFEHSIADETPQLTEPDRSTWVTKRQATWLAGQIERGKVLEWWTRDDPSRRQWLRENKIRTGAAAVNAEDFTKLVMAELEVREAMRTFSEAMLKRRKKN